MNSRSGAVVSTAYKRLERGRGWLLAVAVGAFVVPVLCPRGALSQSAQEDQSSFNAPWEDLLSKIPPPSLGVSVAPLSPADNLVPPPDAPGPLVIEPLSADTRLPSPAGSATTRDELNAETEEISSERIFSHPLPTRPTGAEMTRDGGQVKKAPVARVRTAARSRTFSQSAAKRGQGRTKAVQRIMRPPAATVRAATAGHRRQRMIRESAAHTPTLSMPEGLVPSMARPR
jgi:hypothetical protein